MARKKPHEPSLKERQQQRRDDFARRYRRFLGEEEPAAEESAGEPDPRAPPAEPPDWLREEAAIIWGYDDNDPAWQQRRRADTELAQALMRHQIEHAYAARRLYERALHRRRELSGWDPASEPHPDKPDTGTVLVYSWADKLPERAGDLDYVLLTSEREMIASGERLGNCLADNTAQRAEFWRNMCAGKLLLADFRKPGGNWCGCADIYPDGRGLKIFGPNNGRASNRTIHAAYSLALAVHDIISGWDGPLARRVVRKNDFCGGRHAHT